VEPSTPNKAKLVKEKMPFCPNWKNWEITNPKNGKWFKKLGGGTLMKNN